MRRPRCHETKGVWKSVQNRKAFRETLLEKQSASASCIQWVTVLKKNNNTHLALRSIQSRQEMQRKVCIFGNRAILIWTSWLLNKYSSLQARLFELIIQQTLLRKSSAPTLKMKDFSLTVKVIHSKAGSEWQGQGQGCGTEALLSLCSVCCST